MEERENKTAERKEEKMKINKNISKKIPQMSALYSSIINFRD